ncbi:endonuclease/exonuclease/phosphatase family protein [Patiriisocius hiemis]|uniref:Endonuclease/exonuclease/phosphatase family protein n=1 Tax=Patiriisocius hiemis TaxID=3075604 RepID=A0ABU2YDR8_9FLAO|nr:endonuclease/exonuclease/phosphatase family protein [Constantimarinum sp. W242]MDT0556326.1 endonuclease/exonuclease/phosphatase family protein [Constantimarinum sp. W242]
MIVLYIVCVFFSISAFLPAIENPHWFFRTADFVRLQSIVIEVILLGLLLLLGWELSVFEIIVALGLLVSIGYQLQKVFRYSSIYPRKKPSFPSVGKASIFAANILQDNKSFSSFLKEVNKFDADLVLTMESNQEWENKLKSLEKEYPYTVKIPLENYYGMHLYSKKELHNVSTQFQVQDDVPSIFFEFLIDTNNTIFFTCLHPAPPSPTENETSKERDAELMITGKKIRNQNKPTIVCGDMNDVVWSRTTRLFKKMTGMIDPRVGRGFFPTYHAGYWFMRFPLDHLFHTEDLFVKKMERSKYFGSDHFGMYYEIHLKKKAKKASNPKLDNKEKVIIKEIIDETK